MGGDAAAQQALAEAVLLELVAVGVDEGAEADDLGGVAAGVGGGVAGEQIVEVVWPMAMRKESRCSRARRSIWARVGANSLEASAVSGMGGSGLFPPA